MTTPHPGDGPPRALTPAIPFPIPREEAREDVAHTKRQIARLNRKEAALEAQLAQVRQSIRGAYLMLRTIYGVYPDLAEEREQPQQKPLADLFGGDPDFTGGLDAVGYVRQGRGEDE